MCPLITRPLQGQNCSENNVTGLGNHFNWWLQKHTTSGEIATAQVPVLWLVNSENSCGKTAKLKTPTNKTATELSESGCGERGGVGVLFFLHSTLSTEEQKEIFSFLSVFNSQSDGF